MPRNATRQDASKPTPIVEKPQEVAIFSEDETRDTIGHDAGKSTPSVATLSKDAICSTGDAIGQEVGKTTSSVATPMDATPSRDAIIYEDGLRDANVHAVGKPTPSVATPFFTTTPQDAKFWTDEPRDVIAEETGQLR
jgi:hypothetical protein